MSRSQHANDFFDVSPTSSSEPAAYEIKPLDTLEELVQSYRLRYEVYADLGYLRHPNPSKLEIDEYDSWAIPFGAFEATSRTMVGTLRLVTKQPQPELSRLIQRVLQLFADDSLARQARAPRPHVLPSIISDKIARALAAFNGENFTVSECSRAVVGRNFRGSGVARGLMEFGLAQAAFGGPALLLGSCLPEHLPMNAKYGFQKLPQTGLDLFDSVGQIAISAVCRTDRLPQPTRSHVDELLCSMRTNAAEHATGTDGRSRILYRFKARPASAAANPKSSSSRD
jgi:predicted GNAT family N-acyltransferase